MYEIIYSEKVGCSCTIQYHFYRRPWHERKLKCYAVRAKEEREYYTVQESVEMNQTATNKR